MNYVWFNLVQIVTLAVAYLVICPVGDRLQYAQEWSYLFTQGAIAATSNALTIGIAGSILLAVYAKSQVHGNSLTKE